MGIITTLVILFVFVAPLVVTIGVVSLVDLIRTRTR